MFILGFILVALVVIALLVGIYLIGGIFILMAISYLLPFIILWVLFKHHHSSTYKHLIDVLMVLTLLFMFPYYNFINYYETGQHHTKVENQRQMQELYHDPQQLTSDMWTCAQHDNHEFYDMGIIIKMNKIVTNSSASSNAIQFINHTKENNTTMSDMSTDHKNGKVILSYNLIDSDNTAQKSSWRTTLAKDSQGNYHIISNIQTNLVNSNSNREAKKGVPNPKKTMNKEDQNLNNTYNNEMKAAEQDAKQSN